MIIMLKPKLFEALMKDPEYKSEFGQIKERARLNPFISRYLHMGLKEGILSDMASALGRMHDVVIDAATPKLIGREIIWVQPTTEVLVRFPKAKKGKAYLMGEGAKVWRVGEKYTTVDVQTNVLVDADASWTREFAEDASWPVMERQVAEVGRSIGELETERVLTLYGAIADADLAGGAPIDKTTDTVMDWDYVTALYDAVVNENLSPKVLVLHPRQVSQLWRDDKFIHGFYFGELADVRRGVLGETYLGMKIVSSTLCTNGTAYAIDTDLAAVLLLRRDIVTEPYEDPKKNEYGVVGHERVGLGVLQSKAVAKAVNIVTTL